MELKYRILLLAGLLTAGGLCACKSATPPAPDFEVPVVARLAAAGLAPGKFETVDPKPYGADHCVRGPVDRLDTLLCSYAGSEAAITAEVQRRGFASGAVSGAERVSGTLALAVADRDRVDLQGKTISRLLQAFSAPADGASAPTGSKAGSAAR